MPVRFDGQGWVVVGGAEGIGREVVLLAARRGATVLCSGRSGSEAAAADLLAAARQAGVAERLLFVAADPASPEEVERLFDRAGEQFFALHVLVFNGADGPVLADRPLAETSLAEWNQNLAVHLRGPFLVVQRALQEFLAGGEGGRIVYLIPAGTEGLGQAVVGSALRSLVRSVAKEYGRRGIACNAVLVPDEPAQAVAETVLFLSSAEASFVNGEVLNLERRKRDDQRQTGDSQAGGGA